MSSQTQVLSGKGALQALMDFWQSDRESVIHACKSALAVAIATGICMRLELGNPRTTMVSVAIVMMHQQVGMTIARGVYRLMGMLVGCLVGLLMVVYLSQSFGAFVVVLSCWIACCVWGAFFYRNYQSYGFVLAGYATAILAVPAWSNPYVIVDNVIFTISDVTIAVVTGSAVNALILPQSTGAALFTAGQRHCSHLIGAVRAVLTFTQTPADLDALHLKLNNERTEIEALRSAAVFEDPELRQRSPLLREFASQFLDLTTTLHAIRKVRESASIQQDAVDLADIDNLARRVVALLPDASATEWLSVLDITRTERSLAECLQACQRHEQALPPLREQESDCSPNIYETFSTMVREAIGDLVLYLRLFAALRTPLGEKADARLRLSSRAMFVSTANRWSAASGAARALIVVVVVASVWYASGWNDGSIAITGAAITSALFAIFPNPSRSSRQLLIGALSGSVVAILFTFLVMPHLDGFAMLAAALAPIFMLGSYVGSFPSLGPTGTSFNIFFSYVADVTNPGTYEPTILLDSAIAFCTGIGTAVIAFGLLIPPGGAWMTRFYMRQMRRLVSVDACHSAIHPQSLHRFESGVRDYMTLVGTSPAPDLARQWGFAVLDVGSAVLKVRGISLSARRDLPSQWYDILKHWQESIALLFDAVTIDHHAEALGATRKTLCLLRETGHQTAAGSRALTDSLRSNLHLIEIELLDETSPLHPASAGDR